MAGLPRQSAVASLLVTNIMAIDYKRELERAAKSMILVHEPNLLIKMIVRLMVQRVEVKHAGVLLYHRDKESYVLTVSRGSVGQKIPSGFARMDLDNPLIRFFRERHSRLPGDGIIIRRGIDKLSRSRDFSPESKELLRGVSYQMDILEAVVCVPSYFRDNLMGVLFMGSKKSGRDFRRKELDFFSALASNVAMALRNAQLFKDLEGELDKNKQLFINITMAFVAAIDAKDHYTGSHTERVTDISLKIAKGLIHENKVKIDNNFLEDLQIAGLLHDIGKIGISESILNKREVLTDDERTKIREHTVLGVNILHTMGNLLRQPLLGIRYHHEKYDGEGYPDGLSGEDIPLVASIISVADAFDAMTTDRPYRAALTKEAAIDEIRRFSGKQFNPWVAEIFLKLCHEGKI